MNDLVSIIVPVYNVESYLKKCIESILAQSYRNFELILVNDGSTDTSEDICRDYERKDDRIVLINKSNGGLSDSRNTGIEQAKGVWMLFVDSDDWIDENLCNRCIEHAYETNSDIVVFGLIKVFKDKHIKMSVNDIQSGVIEKNKAMSLLGDDGFGNYAWNKLYKRELFKDIRYPVGKYLEDIGTTCYLFEKANRISYLKEYYYYYLQRNNSIMHSMSSEKAYDQFELRLYQNRFFKNNYPEACVLSNEALVRSAITYCLYFCEDQEEDKVVLRNAAEEIIRQRLPVFRNIKIKVLLLCFFYTECPRIFKYISRIYLKSMGINTKNMLERRKL